MTDAAPLSITLDPDTFRDVSTMARARGMSVEQLAGEMIRQELVREVELLEKVEVGRRQIAAGQGLTHEELVANLQRWKRERKRAA